MSLEIYKGSTYFIAKVHNIEEFQRSIIDKFLFKKLTSFDFDPRKRKFTPSNRYYIYNYHRKYYRIPTSVWPHIEELCKQNNIKYFVKDISPVKPRKISLDVAEGWAPKEHQIEPIAYMQDESIVRRGVQLGTGGGKTFSSTYASIKMGHAFMIIVSGLVDQWEGTLSTQTTGDLQDGSIYTIKGHRSLEKIFMSDVKPQIFICSLETLRKYCEHKGNYEDLPTFEKFVEYYGIGTKIMDEAHLNFHACTMIDLKCNIKNNIYLTATYRKADNKTVKIFDMIYPSSMKKVFGEKSRHTDTTMYGYRGDILGRQCSSPRGYSHIKYEQFSIKYPKIYNNYFENILLPLVYSHWVHKEYGPKKLLIFCSTSDFIKKVVEDLRKHFNTEGYVINSYLNEDPESFLTDSDIIVSTHKGCGTGNDIKNLLTVINTVSFKSHTMIEQLHGRLRLIPDVTTEYVDLVDLNLDSCIRHWKVRKEWLRDLSKSYKEHRM